MQQQQEEEKKVLKQGKTCKKPARQEKAQTQKKDELSSTYKPGEVSKQKEAYVLELVATGEWSKQDAARSWNGSLRRAMLLKDLSVSELVKRRFVSPGAETNPFAERVQQALSAPNVD